MSKFAEEIGSSEGEESEKEWDKLLTTAQNEEPANSGQKYNNNGSPGVSKDPQPQHSSSPFTSRSNVTGDYINTGPQATPIKLPNLEQMKLAEDTPPEEKKTNIKRKILKVVVTCMFITMAVGVIVIWTFHDGGSRDDGELSFFLDTMDMMLIVKRYHKGTTRGYLGGSLFINRLTEPDDCENFKNKGRNKCYTWNDGNFFSMTYFQVENVNCYNISWETVSTLIPVDCYEVDKGYWYGMPESWPSYLQQPLTSFQFGRRQDKNAGMEFNEYLWMSSDGVSIYLSGVGPYLISWNESNSMKLCFAPDIVGDSESDTKRHLDYTICQGYDVKQTHHAISRTYFTKSQHNITNMQTGWWNNPLWSVSDNETINPQVELTKFSEFLQKNDFMCNIIESRTQWQEEIGGISVDSKKFPDIQAMTNKLAASHCQLLLTVSTVCLLSSSWFQFGVEKGYFLLDSISNGIKLMQFYDAQVAIWDVMNDNFTSWYSGILANFSKEFNVKHFKLNSVPYMSMIKTSVSETISLDYYRNWLNVIETVTPFSSLEGTFRTREKQDFLEVDAKLEKSDTENVFCITQSLSGALTSSVSGYPYIMSTAYSSFDYANRDLYIRWLQFSVFFPALKIPSIFQTFGDKYISYTKNMSAFRSNYFLPCLKEMKIDVSESTPIIRPIWWDDMDEEKDFPSIEIGDEFLIGEDLLVAPVLCSDQKERDVYLPLGTWYSPTVKRSYKGRQWIKNMNVPLFEILYFVKEKYKENGSICAGN